MDDSREFQKFTYDPEDYPDPLAEPSYNQEDYLMLKTTLTLPREPFTYTLDLPDYILENTYIKERAISANKATLGRVLFYDKNLSYNKSVSCASCHRQGIAFSDNQKLSRGFIDKETKRNSMALGSQVSIATYHYNSGRESPWAPFLWNLKGSTAAETSRRAITSPIQMGMLVEEVVERVQASSHYQVLFKAAFSDEEITEEKILEGLGSFVLSIGSYESRFDEGMIAAQGDIENDFVSFSVSENRGKALYIRDCGVCHGEKLIRPVFYGNNGLSSTYSDEGAQRFCPDLTGACSHVGQSFKVPALRNIALTAPYMHDGRMESLEEVIDFYSTNIQDHEDLSEELRDDNGNPVKFNYTDQEKQALKDFLLTLTDNKLTRKEKYSNPFK